MYNFVKRFYKTKGKIMSAVKTGGIIYYYHILFIGY